MSVLTVTGKVELVRPAGDVVPVTFAERSSAPERSDKWSSAGRTVARLFPFVDFARHEQEASFVPLMHTCRRLDFSAF